MYKCVRLKATVACINFRAWEVENISYYNYKPKLYNLFLIQESIIKIISFFLLWEKQVRIARYKCAITSYNVNCVKMSQF